MVRSPFYVDGQSYPSQPLRPNYEADQYVDCYRMLTCFRKDINVKRNDYVKGYCLYALEIDPYYSFNVKRQGHCRLEMKFAKPLPESVLYPIRYLPGNRQYRLLQIRVRSINERPLARKRTPETLQMPTVHLG